MKVSVQWLRELVGVDLPVDKLAWVRGLKTTYYLRTLAATSAEKSTGKGGELNAVPASGGMSAMGAAGDGAADGAKFCSIDNPECEACQ